MCQILSSELTKLPALKQTVYVLEEGGQINQ